MGERVTGGIALLLGVAVMIALFLDKTPLTIKPLLGGLAFIALGGYYLVTGKRAATPREFNAQGKPAHEEAPAKKE